MLVIASNSSSKSMKKPGEHPFCWMCAYYGRNLNNPHIAKLCKENRTEFKGMAILVYFFGPPINDKFGRFIVYSSPESINLLPRISAHTRALRRQK